MNYLAGVGSTRTTPQSQPIPGSTQVENSAGGHAWEVDDFERLSRFLILGSEGGSYYASQRQLSEDNAGAVRRCLHLDGERTVKTIVAISTEGRAPKNDPAIFALAMAAADPDKRTRALALDVIPEVCRIGTHLFHFAMYVESFRGWGRGLRKAVGRWYEGDIDALAYQLVKYRQRDGWSHRDLLRLAHPNAPTRAHRALYDWTCNRPAEELPRIVQAFTQAQESADAMQTASLIRDCPDLPREAIQSDHLISPEVWGALLENMPMTAMIRNLATMTRIGLLAPMSTGTQKVIAQLGDTERLRKARVHPIAVLAAMTTYAAGQSVRGSNTWNPVAQIVDALDGAFYEAFQNVEPTGKRHLLALDVSGSMTFDDIAGIPGLTPRVGAAAMALVTAATEPAYETVAFTGGGGYSRRDAELTVLPLSPRQRLDDVVTMTNGLPFGGTDCALPMLYAMQERREVDAFIIYTDSETWAGQIHPVQALRKYREQSGIPAKLIIVGMTSNGFSIADPDDAGMLDVVGFDTAAPSVMADFIR